MIAKVEFMEFIKRMKKREFIELGLKALAVICLAFVATILMEAMIYGIEMNALYKSGKNATRTNETIVYCIKKGEDKYFPVYYTHSAQYITNGSEWSAMAGDLKTKQECLNMEANNSVKKVIFHAPNAFDYSIEPVHYYVIGGVVLCIVGYFTYKFVALTKEYKKIEDKFEKTGEIEITNY